MNKIINKPWFIAGAGAIGTLWAAKWLTEKQDIYIITRQLPETNHIILEENSLQHFNANFVTYESINEPIEQLLITSKSHSTINILDKLKPYLSSRATIIILQNGMASKQLNVLSTQRLLAASTTDGAFSRQRFHSVFAGKGQTLIGDLNPQYSLADTIELRKKLPKTLDIQAISNIEEQLWKKLAINCAINGLTVKYDCLNGQLLEQPESKAELLQICEEIIELGKILNLGDWLQQLPKTVQLVLKQTAKNSSSMREDIRNLRKTEIHEVNGYFCNIAKQHNIDHPANRAITDYIIQREEKYI